MATRGVSRSHASERNLQRLAIEEGHDPTNRPDEARTRETGPSHGLWPGEVVNEARQDLAQDLARRASALDLFCGEVFTLGRPHQENFMKGDALFFREADCRACRLAD